MEPIRVMPKTIPATVYNHVRLALLRIGTPSQFELTTHRGLIMILNRQLWRCVDSTSGGRTIMIWQSFKADMRRALHEPVGCELSIYHMHAGLVMGSVLDELSDIVADRLQRQAVDLQLNEN